MKTNFKETIKKLESEIEKSIELNSPDFSYEKDLLLKTCPEFLLDLSEEYDLIVSGGMITSLFCRREINDIDLYLTNEDDVFPFVIELLQNSTLVSVTDKSLLVNHSGQLINVILFRVFKDAFDIFNSFDFTVCMGAFNLTDETFCFHKDFLKHNSQRTLKFNNNTDFPLVTALRVSKYVNKGYTINKKDFVAILLACVNLDISDYKTLEAHIGGMYGISLDELIDTSVEFDLSNAINQLQESKHEIDDKVDLIWNSPEDVQEEKIKNLLKRFTPKDDLKMVEKTKIAAYPSGRALSINKYMSIPKSDFYNGYLYLYKYVKKTKEAGVFTSFYKSSFQYKLNEEVIDDSHGIHCGVLSSKSDFTYSEKREKVLVELKVHSDDIIRFGTYQNTTIRKAVVTRVLNENYINDNTEETKN